MLKKKRVGLFCDVSDHRLTLLRTTSWANPHEIEALVEIPLFTSDDPLTEVRRFAGTSDAHIPIRVSGRPANRFVEPYHVENFQKIRQPGQIEKVLAQKTRAKPEDLQWVCLHTGSGLPFTPAESIIRTLLYCGAPKAAIREVQDLLVSLTLVPQSFELSTLSTAAELARWVGGTEKPLPVLVAEIGQRQTYSMLISEKGVHLSRMFPLGTETLVKRLQSEMGLRNEEAARRMLISKTLSFEDIGERLLGEIIRELTAFSSSFEVETGETLGYCLFPGLPEHFRWMEAILKTRLGIPPLEPSPGDILEPNGIEDPAGLLTIENMDAWLPIAGMIRGLGNTA